LAGLGIELRAVCILGKHSITEFQTVLFSKLLSRIGKNVFLFFFCGTEGQTLGLVHAGKHCTIKLHPRISLELNFLLNLASMVVFLSAYLSSLFPSFSLTDLHSYQAVSFHLEQFCPDFLFSLIQCGFFF
jgi:hypothetical protein